MKERDTVRFTNIKEKERTQKEKLVTTAVKDRQGRGPGDSESNHSDCGCSCMPSCCPVLYQTQSVCVFVCARVENTTFSLWFTTILYPQV
jgi:hypothetical protein